MAKKVWCNMSQLEVRRLILKMGLGRDIGRNDVASPANPNKLCEMVTAMLSATCLRGWKVTTFLSAGKYGHVFRGVHTRSGESAAIKVQIGRITRFQREVRTQKAFHRMGLAPKVIRSCSFQPRGRLDDTAHRLLNKELGEDLNFPPQGKVHVIIMEEVAGVLGKWLKRPKSKDQLMKTACEIVALAQQLQTNNLTHGDFHLYNIAYVYTNASRRHMKLMLIDFDRSYVGVAHPRLEVGALLFCFWEGKMLEANRKLLLSCLRKLFRKDMNIIIGDVKMWNIGFLRQLRVYMTNYVLRG